ncbi:MAG TPA: HEPN domain-containing protein [Candidatus Avalokitesvara rifleensis]|uniref:HEPN domain-containing protein n=1 Tax=Candidatus Avalokitesvara rifleensis TaxID=3367620 RepID=UPI00271283CA|nr:HEPN domain-containing protein [Candidatus Brocadiales bacterium]
MTNREKADRLLTEAGQIAEGIPGDFKRGYFNLVIRRSQEVVELALKALFCEMGVEYPKIHDVAPLFRKVVVKKGLDIEEGFLNWLEEVSSNLASKRAPAFYLEAEYEKEEAKEAMDTAIKVLDFAKKFAFKLEG